MRCDPRGSTWRRWDLHIHTPASYDYGNKSVNAEQLVEGLVAAGVEVVAVTDHHTIDAGLIRKMQELGADRLTVLPGIELRSQLGGKESVHFTGIFSEDCDVGDVWTKLQSLGITAADVKKKGDDSVFVRFEDGCEQIRTLGGVVVVHAGGKSNTIENLANADLLKQAIKTDYAQRFIHAFEVGKVADCDGYRTKVFPAIGGPLPLFLCSDNHNVGRYTTSCPMWVNADPGHAGLRQVLNEPEGRVFLGDLPPSLSRARLNATKYMSTIGFERSEAAREAEKWFSGTIPLNHGLVAIIGNKGSGKSALADTLALLGDTRASDHFSFLNRDRFLIPKTKLGSMFRAKVTWHSGREVVRPLSEPVNPSVPESVKYIPQSYLETVCSELKKATETRFYGELMEVIFSHVDAAERLGTETLPDLIEYLTNEKEQRILQLVGELGDANEELARLEDQLTEQHRRSLEAQLEQRRAELTAHDKAKPARVREPKQDPKARAAAKVVTAELTGLQSVVKKMEAGVATAREHLRLATAQLASADKLLDRLDNLEEDVTAFYADSAQEAKALGLDVRELVVLEQHRQPILDARAGAERRRRAAKLALAPEDGGFLTARLRTIAAQVEAKRLELDEPNRRYQSYLRQLADWQKKRDELVGSADTASSVRGLEARLAALGELPARIADQKEVRANILLDIFRAKEHLLADYRKLYLPVQEFIDKHPISKKQGALQFSASMAVDGLVEGLLDMIHQGRKGSFQGDQEGRELLRELVSGSDLSTEAGVRAFVASVQDHLDRDKRDGADKLVRLKDQLRQGVLPQNVYDFLYGLSYLKPRFELRWQARPLDRLSPGERGTLLLVFYLLIDKRDVPLIIDQPEENLDNQTIATLLVPAIKDAKERRQIIIVTHNPNLAVVCDADQVIHCRVDKSDGNRVTYTSGAIENPDITRLIVDVLEGTKPAFDLRDAKYQILEKQP